MPIQDKEKIYTAFEADGQLYQFTRVPFGVTNGVACFQRVIDSVIKNENLEGVFAYLDDVTVCGNDRTEHDQNLEKFMTAVRKYNLTVNKEKSSYSKNSIKLLGYLIEQGTIRPDPSRLEPLLNLPVPNNPKNLQRVLGMFSHYSRWIPRFSEKVHILVNSKKFPLSPEAVSRFENIKKDIAHSVVTSIDPNTPFVVETDASDHAIAACLRQSEQPVAFFSRTLSPTEQKHSAVEKEAYAIVESLKKWRHYLIGKKLALITDQKSISFMFDMNHTSKIKNEKILRWRLELSCYNYDIVYRPGKNNTVADTFSRICGSVSSNTLFDLHQVLCHPGVTRMAHWIKSKNMPYSIEEIRKMTAECPTCAEIKPRFNRTQGKLIKATQPFERLNIDFKGPLPSATRNKYLLTVVDEFSRFPFAFPCSDMTSETVIKCLNKLFSIFGLASYVHSDQGANFMSRELKSYLHTRNIATSRSTPYNPEGNGQVERYNGIIWKTITLALKTRNRNINQWEEVLSEALHSIRSLLCTAINCTPHERMFTHPRKSSFGKAIPTWLTNPGPVLVRKQIRHNKYDPLVEEAELIEANPEYALVKFPDGRETNISLKHLAPRGSHELLNNDIPSASDHNDNDDETQSPVWPKDIKETMLMQENQTSSPKTNDLSQPRYQDNSTEIPDSPRLTRSRRKPKYLEDYIEN